jgi:hypothetical protein
VWMPSGSTGLSLARPSIVVSRGPWSLLTTIFSPLCSPRGPSSPTIGASMAKISRAKRSSATARAAFSCEASPNASTSSRLMPCFLAMRSAASNWLGMS